MAKSNEPVWWGLFSAGMAIGAFFVPALILITGFILPRNALGSAEAVHALLNNFLVRAFLFVVISLSFFHWAHRFRFTLIDLGIKNGRGLIAFVCYGGAIAGTVVAGLVAAKVL